MPQQGVIKAPCQRTMERRSVIRWLYF